MWEFDISDFYMDINVNQMIEYYHVIPNTKE